MAARRKRVLAPTAPSEGRDEKPGRRTGVPGNPGKLGHGDKGEKEQDDLSWGKLVPAILVSSLVSAGSYYTSATADMAEDVVVCTLRTFVQLSFLAALLSPLFRFVEKQQSAASTIYSCSGLWQKMSAPFLVLSYVFCFMLPLAAHEASARTKLTLRPTDPVSSHDDNGTVFRIVVLSLFTAVTTMGAVLIFGIIQPVPRFSPRHVIPLCGMLLNNALSGTSLAIDVLLTELQSKQRETIELMISFGADAWTATRPSFQSVLASALKPQINSMNVIGLVAIPGMMTGTLLAGASPTRAARYQIIIMCLILGAVFIAVGMSAQLVLWNAFDQRGALRDDWIVENNSMRVSQIISFLAVAVTPMARGDVKSKEDRRNPLPSAEGDESRVTVVELSTEAPQQPPGVSLPHLQVFLHGSFANGKRVMTANFDIPAHGIAILKGESGTGKSTLLKAIAEMNSGFIVSSTSTRVSLSGRDRQSFHPSEWRQRILYVPQDGSSSLEGSPQSFLSFVALSLHHSDSAKPLSLKSLTARTTNYIESWGVPQSKLSQPWSKLSGGQSQRVLLGIALATEPNVLLLDEGTASLDMGSKLKVESSLKESAAKGCAMIVVTHDEDQMRRLGTVWMSLNEVSL